MYALKSEHGVFFAMHGVFVFVFSVRWILDVKAFPLHVRWCNGHNGAYVLAF